MAKQERIEQAAVCREIGARTGGDILIGVVGPVRTGKSTLIKQFITFFLPLLLLIKILPL